MLAPLWFHRPQDHVTRATSGHKSLLLKVRYCTTSFNTDPFQAKQTFLAAEITIVRPYNKIM